jgi:hypothetical protein
MAKLRDNGPSGRKRRVLPWPVLANDDEMFGGQPQEVSAVVALFSHNHMIAATRLTSRSLLRSDFQSMSIRTAPNKEELVMTQISTARFLHERWEYICPIRVSLADALAHVL